MFDVQSIIISIVIFVGTGFLTAFFIKRKFSDDFAYQIILYISSKIALPLFYFTVIIKTFSPDLKSGWHFNVLWFLVFSILMIIISSLSKQFFRKKSNDSLFESFVLQDAFFLPVFFVWYNAGSESILMVNLLIFSIFAIPAKLLAERFIFKTTNRMLLTEMLSPVLIFSMTAIFLKITNLHGYIPLFVYDSIEIISKMTPPLILIIFGFALLQSVKIFKKPDFYNLFSYLLIRNFIIPIVLLGAIYALNVNLGQAVPVLLYCSLNAGADYLGNEDKKESSSVFLISFVISLAELPLLMGIINKIY